jgi:hypothetical protein
MLYGMQGMSSDVPEVRSVLDMLPALLAAAEPLSSGSGQCSLWVIKFE